MNTQPLHDEAWPYVLTLLPANFEETARSTQALVRCRNIPNAASLLRLALAYAVSDLSLKDVAAWAHATHVADITGPGLFYRLREAEAWLQQLLAATLQEGVPRTPLGIAGHIRLVDASVITGPGSQGTDWRIHAMLEPITGTLRSVEVTDARGGEGYGRFNPEPGDIVLGDRAYGRVRGIAAVQAAQAHALVRLTPQAIRLCNLDRRVVRVTDWEPLVPQVGPLERAVMVPIPPENARNGWRLSRAQEWIPARVVGARTRDGEIIWLLTTVDDTVLSAIQVLSLYRLRWQVELAFKRLKSLLHLDTLPTREGPTAKSWLLAKLLAAALAQRFADPTGTLSPWGYELREARVYS